MRSRFLIVFGVLAAALAVGVMYYRSLTDLQPATAPVLMAIQERDCDFSSSYGHQIDCYWANVGEPGARARLAVAVFRAGAEGAVDPLVYLAGGPGEEGSTGRDSLSIWDEWLDRVAISRDFVLLDPRGLSPSEPAWRCENYTKVSRDLLNRQLTFAEEGALLAPVLEECLTQWQSELHKRGGPVATLDAFTSELNARDLDIVLRNLGYREWNFLAVSYGTRVALLAAMQQPEVRRIILDSPYPPERGSMDDALMLWVEAFVGFWRRCEQSSCPFGEDRFWQLMADLRERPVWVEVENWRTGRNERWLLNDGRLAAAIYTAFYRTEMANKVASALDQYTRGQRDELTQILEVFFNQAFDSRFNSAIYWATECNDNALIDQATYEQASESTGSWRSYFASDWQYSVCRSPAFRSGQLPPMQSIAAPALVAVGSLDPITTEAHARSLMEWLPNGHLLVQEHNSHAEFFMGECGQQLIPWFLSAAPEEVAELWPEKSALCLSGHGHSER